jgi:hypothetical protein
VEAETEPLLLRANPLGTISNVRQVHRAVKRGVIYHPEKLLNPLEDGIDDQLELKAKWCTLYTKDVPSGVCRCLGKAASKTNRCVGPTRATLACQ